MTSSLYRNADAVILMYSLDDALTFGSLECIANDAMRRLDPGVEVTWTLIGNKCDRPPEIDSLQARGEDLAERLEIEKMPHMLISVKTGENVLEALSRIIEDVCRRKKAVMQRLTPPEETIKITTIFQRENERGGRCCPMHSYSG